MLARIDFYTAKRVYKVDLVKPAESMVQQR